ncbi:MAG: M23 family metallopeptidase [Myxococcota bacterium]
MWAATWLWVLSAPASVYLDDAPPPMRRWELGRLTAVAPLMVEQGRLLVVDLIEREQPSCRHLRVRWQDRFWPTHRAGEALRAWMPVQLESPIGPAPLWVECDGVKRRIEVQIQDIVPKLSRHKPRGRPGRAALRVLRRFGEPPLDRVRRESLAIGRAFANASRERLWTEQFLRPAAGVDTSAFGAVRTFRGRRSVHEGLDIAGGATDAVYAANDGRVILVADDYFFIGNAVVIDHGEGLLTLYLHLETSVVRQDQMVKRGEPLGTIGNTGRVTGPHLHFAVRYRGRYVDPNDVLRFDPARPLPDALAAEFLTPDRLIPDAKPYLSKND